MPFVEISWWSASEAFLADPSIVKPGLDRLIKVDGCTSIYSGFSIEEPKLFHLATAWESVEHYKASKDAGDHPGKLEEFKAMIGNDQVLTINLTNFFNDHSAAINSPVTEVMVQKLKDGRTIHDYFAVIASFSAHQEGKPKPQAGSVGQVQDEPGNPKFLSLVGWTSVEHHLEMISAIKEGPVQEMLKVADLSYRHVIFSKHT